MKKEILWPLVVAVITLLIGQGVVYKLYYTPRMSYEMLPIHRIDSQQTLSVIIINRGKVLLHNVVISLKSRLPIHKIRLEGPEIIDTSGAAYLISGKIGETAIQLGLNRLVTKSNYILTILTDKDSEVDITITSDEVEANKEIQKKGVGIFEYVSNVLIAVFLGFLTYVSFRMRRWKKVIKELDERLVSTSLCLDRRQESGKKLLNFYDFVIDKLQYMASTLKQAKDQYENKEFVFELLNKYDQINKELTKAFKDMAEDIKIEGICYDVKKDKTS